MTAAGRAGVALGFLGIALLMVYPVKDPDLWWLLASGQYMVEHRTFLTTDPFSASSRGATWINHAWGFQLILYTVYRAGGTTGLILLQVAFALLTFGLLYRQVVREGGSRGWGLLVVGLGALATRGFWEPRPQLVTYFLLAVFWIILRDYVQGRRDRLGWLIPLTVLWINLHAGFAIGLILVGLTTLAEGLAALTRDPAARGFGRPIRLAAIGLASGAAALLNPFHLHAVLFPFQVLSERVAQAVIIEWASPPFSHPQVRLIEGLLLLTLVLLLASPRRAGWPDVVVLVVATHLAVHATRNLPLFVLLLIPVLGRLLDETVTVATPALGALGRLGRSRPVLAVGAVAVLAVAAGLTAPADLRRELTPRLGLAPDMFPEGAVAFLAGAGREGGVFNDYFWGGYLIWRLYPAYPVWVDGRAAVHGPTRLLEYVEVDEVRPRWRETLERTGMGLVLVRARSRLASVLRASPEWEVLYHDHVAVVLGRRRATS
ncbi:MAG TPA: hypothetical protein VLD61_09780 [Methylomirabilota bacterium]|nr:hypothetical protein [Methylomirabilota bacterium]